MLERGGAVVLDEKVRVPGEGVTEQRHADQKPQIDGEREAEHHHGEHRADRMQHARLRSGVGANVFRPEIGEAAALHGNGAILPRSAMALQLLRLMTCPPTSNSCSKTSLAIRSTA